MGNFFLAGNELVRWELALVKAGAGGDRLRLTVNHSAGDIVEYFTSTQAALEREQEIEHLLIAARGYEQPHGTDARS